MDQLEEVERIRFAQAVDHLHEFARAHAELALLAARLGPAAESLGGELDPHAGRGPHAHLARDAEQRLHFRHLLEHDEHTVAQLLPHEREPHELLVLVAIAHDRVGRILAHREHDLEFRLAAAFEPDAHRRAELDDLLHDVPLLIHLHRIHERVAAVVGEFLHRVAESDGERLDAAAEDVREAQEHRESHALRGEVGRHLEKVQFAIGTRAVGAHHRAAARVDVEVAQPPALNVVQQARVLDRPRRDRMPARRGQPAARRRA